jgi:hypothetical protein
MGIMHAIGEFLKVWGPWITLSLIPTLIVGLSKSPKTRGIVDVLKYILQFLSVVTPVDHPGTFKLPLTASAKLPPKVGGKMPGTGPLVTLILAGSLLASATLSGNAGCSWITSIGKGSKEGVINCGVEAVMSDAANLIATVKAIITGGAINWKDQLNALKALGEDALACALYVVGDELQMDSTPPVAMTDAPEKAKARAVAGQGAKKVKIYLSEKGWKPTKAVH